MSEDNIVQACLRDIYDFVNTVDGSVSEDGIREIFQRNGVEAPITSSELPELLLLSLSSLCANKNVVAEDMLLCLMEYFPNIDSIYPDSASAHILSPLHVALVMKHVTPSIVRVLIDAIPSSVRSKVNGSLPIHFLCSNEEVMDETAVEIL